jgi:BlaI family transcriptional regulator, penicillinase repressor
MRQRAIRVAAGEMELLSLLWGEGPLTLREAHERFAAYGKPVGYPTMQTRLNRLVEKGIVARTAERPATYRATATRDQVTLGHLRQLVAKLSRGDVVPLVARLLSDRALTPEQISELEELLAQARQNSKPSSKRRSPS